MAPRPASLAEHGFKRIRRLSVDQSICADRPAGSTALSSRAAYFGFVNVYLASASCGVLEARARLVRVILPTALPQARWRTAGAWRPSRQH